MKGTNRVVAGAVALLWLAGGLAWVTHPAAGTPVSDSVPTADNQSTNVPVDSSGVRIVLSCAQAATNALHRLRFIMATPPTHGSVKYLSGPIRISYLVPTNREITVNDWTYVPEPGYVGPDSLQWKVSDGIATSGVGTYSFNVLVVSNQPPATFEVFTPVRELRGGR